MVAKTFFISAYVKLYIFIGVQNYALLIPKNVVIWTFDQAKLFTSGLNPLKRTKKEILPGMKWCDMIFCNTGYLFKTI